MTNFPQSLDQSATGDASLSIKQLRKLVATNTARWRRIVLFQALGIAIAVPLAFLLIMLWLDNALHLPMWGRFLGFAGFVGLLIAMVVRLVRQWRGLKLTEDQVALSIEQQAPAGLENRLINALQLDRDANRFDPAVARAVVQENCQHLARLKLQPAVQLGPAMTGLGMALAVIAVGAIFWTFNGTYFTNAAQRMLMPFANIDPIYETVLNVSPGNVTVDRGESVALTIDVERNVPDYLTLERRSGDETRTIRLPVDRDTRTATHTFSNVMMPITYSVSGGDYDSGEYRVNVPVPSRLAVLEAELDFPDYTGQATEARRQRRGGLEALYGTQATLRFTLSGPADQAAMLLEKPYGSVSEADAAQATTQTHSTTRTTVRRELRKVSDTEYVGKLTFKEVLGYRLETRSSSGYSFTSERYRINVQSDEPPSMMLTGLDGRRELALDTTLGLTVKANDDFGLEQVGLFVQRVSAIGGSTASNNADQSDAPQSSAQAQPQWQPVQTWSARNSGDEFEREHTLPVTALNAIEGERLVLAVRAVDNAPRRSGQWVTGPVFRLTIGGHGAELQRMYERILATEKALEKLVEDQDDLVGTAIDWQNKLKPGSGMRWDDQKNLDALAKATGDAANEQAALRERAGEIARGMVMDVSHLQRSLGMLADTEMVLARRILEKVAGFESPSDKRTALSDAQITQERTVKSLNEILEQYRQFRRDWELANMMAFLQMLGERQERMSATSAEYASKSGGPVDQSLADSMLRRQKKVRELVGLAQTAFEDMATRTEEVGETMASAFGEAAGTLASETVTGPFQRAESALQPPKWSQTVAAQEEAAEALLAVHAQLKQARTEAARQAIEEVKAQKEKLKAEGKAKEMNKGSLQGLLTTDPSKLNVSEIVDMRNVGKDMKKLEQMKPKVGEKRSWFADGKDTKRQYEDDGKRQSSDILKLADQGAQYSKYTDFTPGERNQVTPHIQEEFEDVVGELIDQIELTTNTYQSINRTKATTTSEPGEITAGANEMNSTAASAATGNQKPGPTNTGGASRAGRQGARNYGTAVGDKFINRRGRDKAQEGDFFAPDTPGEMQEIMTDDPQTDMSAGLGGKDVKSSRATAWNKDNAGKWTNKALKHMQEAKGERLLVERSTGKVDPDIAEALRDLTSQQEQIVKRVKRVRKELDKMYLPTGRLEELERELEANLEKLKTQPDADVFRRQQATLQELRTVAVMFNRAAANFQPSVRREQRIEGRILDEPAAEPIPGYDEAVKRYYQKLANP